MGSRNSLFRGDLSDPCEIEFLGDRLMLLLGVLRQLEGTWRVALGAAVAFLTLALEGIFVGIFSLGDDLV